MVPEIKLHEIIERRYRSAVKSTLVIGSDGTSWYAVKYKRIPILENVQYVAFEFASAGIGPSIDYFEFGKSSLGKPRLTIHYHSVHVPIDLNDSRTYPSGYSKLQLILIQQKLELESVRQLGAFWLREPILGYVSSSAERTDVVNFYLINPEAVIIRPWTAQIA
jgi:hypothetical protein